MADCLHVFEAISWLVSLLLNVSLKLSGNKSRSAKKFTVLLDSAPTEKAVKNVKVARGVTVSSLSSEGSLPAKGSWSVEDLKQQLADEIGDGLVTADVGRSTAFKLTGIAEAADGSSIGLQSSNDPQAQEIINSLAATVGNLTQDVIAKEKRVQFLEDRLQALKIFQAQEEAQ
jgi:hypothetical protein